MGSRAQTIGDAWSGYNEQRRELAYAYAMAGNVSFANEWFYCASVPVMRYMQRPGGEKYVLITSAKTDRATSAKIAQAREFVTVPKFTVPIIKVEHHDHHLDNVRSMWDILIRLGGYAVRDWNSSELRHGHWQLAGFTSMWEHTQLYIAYTGVKFQLTPLDIMIATLEAERQDRKRAWQHPDAVRKRERAAAKRLAIEVLNL